MTDLEITKLCAEAMGWKLEEFSRGFRCRDEDNYVVCIIGESSVSVNYNPLHNDAQAMALVKRFALAVMPNYDRAWNVSGGGVVADNADLNRAICECVANMQQAKGDK